MGPPPSTALHHRELAFEPGDPAACGAGIACVRQALADWRLAPDDIADAVLVAAELLTNAWKHAEGPEHLSVDHSGGVLRIAVTDRSPTRPRLGEHRAESIGGHGIFIIDSLALRWGTQPAGEGKAVWAELRTGSGA
ncbi:ATP-binding protein [Streptomyces sp. NRRL F-2664]|uniref:ATP-binding protein n=1 Tax=Streptomyces sp. NRRL F-2664 TaxID=1463842 RepID=UPI0006918210|nr:ATP-binding protein [Streptomyces sp. NRRL F-2664]